MSFEPESFVSAAEIAPLPDMHAALREFSKSVGAKPARAGQYPRRPELLKMLGDIRGSIDRINATD